MEVHTCGERRYYPMFNYILVFFFRQVLRSQYCGKNCFDDDIDLFNENNNERNDESDDDEMVMVVIVMMKMIVTMLTILLEIKR